MVARPVPAATRIDANKRNVAMGAVYEHALGASTVQRVRRFLLVRHGESEWNAVGRWQGQADPPLSQTGSEQARLAAQSIGMVDAIVASSLRRAFDTAHIISENLGIGPVIVEPDLMERHAGEWLRVGLGRGRRPKPAGRQDQVTEKPDLKYRFLTSCTVFTTDANTLAVAMMPPVAM